MTFTRTRGIRPLACTAYSDQSHRIALCRHITAPHSELPKLMQNAPNVNSALGRQRERMQPEFNGTRLCVSDRTLPPVRKYVVCQPLIIAVACADPPRVSAIRERSLGLRAARASALQKGSVVRLRRHLVNWTHGAQTNGQRRNRRR